MVSTVGELKGVEQVTGKKCTDWDWLRRYNVEQNNWFRSESAAAAQVDYTGIDRVCSRTLRATVVHFVQKTITWQRDTKYMFFSRLFAVLSFGWNMTWLQTTAMLRSTLNNECLLYEIMNFG